MITILHEDDDLIALTKPAGLSTQAPPIAGDSLDARVRAHLAPGDPASAFVGAPHRLDRPVSGVLVWAKNRRAARILTRQFERRQVQKVYWAVVDGGARFETALWSDWIVRDETGLGRAQVCGDGTPRAQSARTRVQLGRPRVLPPDSSWLVLIPETGRTHQLRVQSAARSLPIRGDELYGSKRSFLAHAIALHARSIAIRHPGDGRSMTFTAPLPQAWAEAGIDIE